MSRQWLSIGGVLALAGCANITGLDGATSSFACKAAPGVTCQSVSGVYQNSVTGNLPLQQIQKEGEKGSGAPLPEYGDPGRVSPRDMEAPSSGAPLRSSALVLRIWMAPWEDRNGDLYDQSYFYTVVDTGRWMIDSMRENIREKYMPVFRRPPSSGNQADPKAAGSGVPKVPPQPGGQGSLPAGQQSLPTAPGN